MCRTNKLRECNTSELSIVDMPSDSRQSNITWITSQLLAVVWQRNLSGGSFIHPPVNVSDRQQPSLPNTPFLTINDKRNARYDWVAKWAFNRHCVGNKGSDADVQTR